MFTVTLSKTGWECKPFKESAFVQNVARIEMVADAGHDLSFLLWMYRIDHEKSTPTKAELAVNEALEPILDCYRVRFDRGMLVLHKDDPILIESLSRTEFDKRFDE